MSNPAKKPKRANDSGGAADSLFAHLKPIVDNPRVYNSLVKKNHYPAAGGLGIVRCDLCSKLVPDNESYYSADKLPNADLCTPCFLTMKKLASPYKPEISAPTNVVFCGGVALHGSAPSTGVPNTIAK